MKKISLSYEYSKELLESREAEFREAWEKSCSYNGMSSPSTKALERQRIIYSNKIQKLVNAKDKDNDNIPFEYLGIDMLVVDEAHAFKNLATPTNLSEIKGISSSGSQRSEDMLMKCDYIRSRFGSKALLFATGTPVANSMTELYTMTRYLSPESLTAIGVDSFDKWASLFTNIETRWEILPEGGGLQQKRAISSFKNMPELMNIVGEFADIKSREDLTDLDVPEVEEHIIDCEPTKEQQALIKYIYNRAQKLRKENVDPKEDNFLKVTTDARKLSLDARLLLVNSGIDVEKIPEPIGGKLNKCVDNVYHEYMLNNQSKGTQLVFCDTSTPASNQWNVYDEMKRLLVARGIPENDIAFVHDAKTDKQRATLFENVRNGKIRVLLGSTQKLGTGTNVQDLLVATHDLDCPWRPADLEQRRGRIERAGNKNKKVRVYRYVTKNTFDAYLYDLVAKKQHFISQVLNRHGNERVVDEIGTEIELSFSDIASVAMGDPRLKERMELETDIRRLKISRTEFLRQQQKEEHMIDISLPKELRELNKKISAFTQNKKQFDLHKADKTGIEIDGIRYVGDEINKANKELYVTAVKAYVNNVNDTGVSPVIGHYKTFDVVLMMESSYLEKPTVALRNPNNKYLIPCNSCLKQDSNMNITLLNNAFKRIDDDITMLEVQKVSKGELLNKLRERRGSTWDKQQELEEKEKRFENIDRGLKIAESEFEKRSVEDITIEGVIKTCNLAHDNVALPNTKEERQERTEEIIVEGRDLNDVAEISNNPVLQAPQRQTDNKKTQQTLDDVFGDIGDSEKLEATAPKENVVGDKIGEVQQQPQPKVQHIMPDPRVAGGAHNLAKACRALKEEREIKKNSQPQQLNQTQERKQEWKAVQNVIAKKV